MTDLSHGLQLVHEVLGPVLEVLGVRFNTYEATEGGGEEVRCTVDGKELQVAQRGFSVLGPQLQVHLSTSFHSFECHGGNRFVDDCLSLWEVVIVVKLDARTLGSKVNFLGHAYGVWTAIGKDSNLILLCGKENRDRNFLVSKKETSPLLTVIVVGLHIHIEKLAPSQGRKQRLHLLCSHGRQHERVLLHTQ